jgi:hypothetical protein
MRPDERLGLARQAYERAVAVAREDCTPRIWGRLLTAARNLDDAKRDRERERSRPQHRRLGGIATGEQASHSEANRSILIPFPSPAGPEREQAPVTVESPDESIRDSRAPCRRFMPISDIHSWVEMMRNRQRARLLRERARQLVAESRALRQAIAEQAAGRAHGRERDRNSAQV